MSLSSCLRKAGKYITQDDRVAIMSLAKDLRASGVDADQAGVQAVAKQTDVVRAAIEAITGRAEPVNQWTPKEPAPEPTPDADDSSVKRSTKRDVTETPEFKAWSKGLPVYEAFDDRASDRGVFKLYHATTADFSEFKPGGLKPSDSGPAIWLSADPSATSAAFRVGNEERGFRTGAQVMPVYARVASPMVIDDKATLDWAREAFANGSREFPQLISKDAVDTMKEDGYDSIIFDGKGVGWKDAPTEVIVLDPTQVKSAIGNNGQFSTETGDITKSRKRNPSEIFGREIAPAAIKAYESLSVYAKNIIDNWNVNWDRGQGKLRDSENFDEIIKAYEPVREKLRQVYGDTVPAYRGERVEDRDSGQDRFLFSWTPMREIAAGFAVNRLRGVPPEITQAEVDKQVEAYKKTGIARLGSYKFVRKDPGDFEPDGPDYYHIYHRDEMLTDGDDVAEQLQRDKDERDEWIAELKSSGKLYTAEIPVDSIAFIPVNANLRQPEFVAEYNPRKDDAQEISLSTKRNDMGFYSALAKGIESMQTKSAPAGAWKAQIKGLVNKGAVKQDEITWSGIEDWLDLQEGKITKEAITDYLEQGGVKVEEVVLGARDTAAMKKAVADFEQKHDLDVEYDEVEGITALYDSDEGEIKSPKDWFNKASYAEYKALDELIREGVPGKNVKYGSYTLPGGSNYREVLLTLPKNQTAEAKVAAVQAREISERMRRADTDDEYELLRGERQRLAGMASESPAYKSSHWDQPNVLAHIRVNDRTDADGKRVLLVEEIQSDWQAATRKAKTAIKKAVDSSFNEIVERMKTAGILSVECD